MVLGSAAPGEPPADPLTVDPAPVARPTSTGATTTAHAPSASLFPLVAYFLKLGTIGFGGPVALAGFMHRDLVEQRQWITDDTYKLALALAQIMPGPLASGADTRVLPLNRPGVVVLDNHA
jgi:hypothetical protein